MSEKHTPGPWSAEFDADDPELPINIEKDGGAIACVYNLDDFPCVLKEDESRVSAEAKANANLIAAAPELLEALTRVRDWLSSFEMPPTSTLAEKQEHLAIIDKAIAKAEGRDV